MSVLTPEQLAESNLYSHYDLPFHPNPALWAKLDRGLNNILGNPQKIKFDENIRASLSSSAKGIYMFFVRPEFPFNPEVTYLMYVGKVAGNNNFRNRFGEYVNSIGSINQRRNIQLLTNCWPNQTWVYIFELSLSDDEIERIESNLINNIIPPCNAAYEGAEAKRTRSILH